MARFKPLFVAAGVLLLIAVGLGAYDVVGESIIEARAEVTRTNLSSIGRKVAEFRATRGRFPRGAEEWPAAGHARGYSVGQEFRLGASAAGRDAARARGLAAGALPHRAVAVWRDDADNAVQRWSDRRQRV